MEYLKDLIGKLPPEEKSHLLDVFFDTWTINGFGSMTKKDTELLLFSCIDHTIDKENGRDNYSWAKLLMLPPSKIRSMRLEAELKFGRLFEPRNTNEILQRYFSTITNLSLNFSTDNLELKNCSIYLLVQNPVIKMEIEHALTDMGGILHYDLMPDVVYMTLADFLLLVNSVVSGNEENAIRTIVQKSTKEIADTEAMDKLIKGKAYANMSEGQKLLSFVGVLFKTFMPDEGKELMEHLKLIFGSWKARGDMSEVIGFRKAERKAA